MNNSIYKNPIYFEYLAWGLLCGLIVLPIIYYGQLPDQIPSHFNAKGEADAFSKKSSIWVLPIVGTAVFLLLHFLSTAKKLQINYPKELTDVDQETQQLIGRKLLNALKIVIPAFFLYITYRSISMALGQSEGLGAYFLYVFIVVIFGVIFYFMRQMSMAKTS